jgi:hypothetical protein
MNLRRHIRGGLSRRIFSWICLAVCWRAELLARDKNVRFVPELKKEQVLLYDIHGRVQRHVKTESRVASILEPREAKQEFSGRLRVTIKELGAVNGRPFVSAEAAFEYAGDAPESTPAAKKHFVEFTIGGNGRVKSLTGLYDLDPVERMAWQFWISRFAFGWTFPQEKLKRGEKWKNEEPENNPAPIGKLVWERETTYGENGKCPVVPSETCAVFFTNAVMKQKSSPKDSTPEDYRLHELRTSGTATGTNEIYTTISQKTGLAMRGTEEVRQSMNVIIVKSDGSNGVKYSIDAASHFEMLLVADGAGP